jgi:hypothetical protein
MATTHALRSAASVATEHPGAVKVVKVGWLGKGIVYLLAGILALVVVAHSFGWSSPTSADEEASPTGAVKTVAGSPGGDLLLILLAVALFMYALWRVVTAILPGELDAKGWAIRIGYLASAAMYVILGLTALKLTKDEETADGNRSVRDVAGKVMANTAGRWLVGIIGLVLIGAGLYRLFKVVKGERDDEVDLSGMSHGHRRTLELLGIVGEVGRGAAVALVGFFLVRATLKYNADEATGLDGALRRLADSTWGALVVAVIGLGFVTYGVYCVLTFHRRKLKPAS